MVSAKEMFQRRLFEGGSIIDENPLLAISKLEAAANWIADDRTKKKWLEKKERIDGLVEQELIRSFQETRSDNSLDRYTKRMNRRMEMTNWEAREKLDTLKRIALEEGLVAVE